MTFDWFFTEDGDLLVGPPKVDENGEALYRHADGTISTEKGETGRTMNDLEATYDLEADKQIVLNRLRTDSPDWYHHPAMGGNLSDLIGEPNTKATGDAGIVRIQNALTYGGLYHITQVSVRAVPISEDSILFYVEILKPYAGRAKLPIVFSLSSGLLDYYEG